MTDLITIPEVDGNLVLLPEIAAEIAAFENQVKVINEKEKALKAAILAQMEKHGCVKLDTDVLTITYVPETDRESLDTKTLKEECPDVYDTYVKISTVKPSLRIKVR